MLFSAFVSVALKSTAVLGVAWLAAWVLRGRSAAARHLVWTGAAAAVLALPFLSVSLPAWHVPASGVLLDPGLVFRTAATAVDLTGKWTGTMTHDQGESNSCYMDLKAEGAELTGTAGPDASGQFPIQDGKVDGSRATFRVVSPGGGVFAFDLNVNGDSLRGTVNRTLGDEKTAGKVELKRASPAAAMARTAPGGPAAAWRPDWRIWLMLLWTAGAAAALARMLVACAVMWRVRRAARPFPDGGLARALAEALGIRHQVVVLETRRGGMPMTFGLLRPTIFMPAEAAEWSEERRRVVLLHEMGHVRRGDVATHLMARTALSLYWWNPLAWTAWREFLKERERATDDLVLNAGAHAADYAAHLLEVARTMQSAPATAWAAVAMARRSQLEGRLLAILDSGVNRKPPGRAAALVAALLAVGVIAPLAAMRPQAKAEQVISPEVDATIRAAMAQRNHAILEDAAAAFEKLRRYDEARKLREAALAIRGEVSGQQSPDYAVGLVKLGDVARQQGKRVDALAFYTQAVALGDRPEVASALLYLGIDANDPSRSLDLLQRARNVAPTGHLLGQAMTWMARARQAQEGAAPEAESLYQSALSMEDPNSPAAALTMELFAGFLSERGREAESEFMKARAGDIRKARVAELSPKREPAGQASRVGGGTSAPVLLHKLEPSYSPEARAAKYQGTVVLYAEIGEDGKAYNIKLVKGIGFGLDEEAVNAISQWEFGPGTRGGMPVTVQATIEVNFRLM